MARARATASRGHRWSGAVVVVIVVVIAIILVILVIFSFDVIDMVGSLVVSFLVIDIVIVVVNLVIIIFAVINFVILIILVIVFVTVVIVVVGPMPLPSSSSSTSSSSLFWPSFAIAPPRHRSADELGCSRRHPVVIPPGLFFVRGRLGGVASIRRLCSVVARRPLSVVAVVVRLRHRRVVSSVVRFRRPSLSSLSPSSVVVIVVLVGCRSPVVGTSRASSRGDSIGVDRGGLGLTTQFGVGSGSDAGLLKGVAVSFPSGWETCRRIGSVSLYLGRRARSMLARAGWARLQRVEGLIVSDLRRTPTKCLVVPTPT